MQNRFWGGREMGSCYQERNRARKASSKTRAPCPGIVVANNGDRKPGLSALSENTRPTQGVRLREGVLESGLGLGKSQAEIVEGRRRGDDRGAGGGTRHADHSSRLPFRRVNRGYIPNARRLSAPNSRVFFGEFNKQ